MNRKKVLIVVAHPDDETIWMGGTIIRNKGKWDTTIISLCRKNDSDRAPKFHKVCKILNSKSFISDLDDEKFFPLKNEVIIKEILKFSKKNYDFIYTHNSDGEYGHIRHKEVNSAIKEMITKKKINAGKIFFFSYEKRKNDFQGYAIYNSNADILIKLNSDEISLKKKLIMDVYGFQKGGFEEMSAGEIEAFLEYKK